MIEEELPRIHILFPDTYAVDVRTFVGIGFYVQWSRLTVICPNVGMLFLTLSTSDLFDMSNRVR